MTIISNSVISGSIGIGTTSAYPTEGICRDWIVRGTIAPTIYVNRYSMPEGKTSHCILYAPRATPREGCLILDPKKYPIFRDEKNFDFRLRPNSPCKGKASDGGDIGARITPHMFQMLQLGKKTLNNGGKVTPELLEHHVAGQNASKQRKKSRSRKMKK